jgi:hypothetical protein
MNRRTIFKSILSGIALLGLRPQVLASANSARSDDDHDCSDSCYHAAEKVAREIIKETGHWKIGLHDWTKRRMVVTQCGNAACEVGLEALGTPPVWMYRRRRLTSEEKDSFRAEYGRSHDLILCFRRDGERFLFRGFVLNGREDGWNLSANNNPINA